MPATLQLEKASNLFTGLVEGKARLTHIESIGSGKRLTFDLGVLTEGVQLGDSIALSGCCLTVVCSSDSMCIFELGSETLSRTGFNGLQIGDEVNCERSLRVGDRLGGHFVTGHIDGRGEVVRIDNEGEWKFFRIRTPTPLLTQIASKGSVTIDGVSLTIVDVDLDEFSVALIPHTLEVTTLGKLKVGEFVNLETDILAKYVGRLKT